MERKINPNAAEFARKVGGSVEEYRGLSIVTYDYGRSPSVAHWRGRQRRACKNLHFLSKEIRTRHIEDIKSKQTSQLLYRASRRIERRLLKVWPGTI